MSRVEAKSMTWQHSEHADKEKRGARQHDSEHKGITIDG
jgi:hypothetical protein